MERSWSDELLDLLLVRRHALEPGNRRDHLEQQIQLGVLRHLRLDEQRAALRVDAGADPVGHVVVGVRDEVFRVGVLARQGVPVDDEKEAVVVLLHVDPVVERADQVAEMQAACRPHAGQDATPGGHGQHSHDGSRDRETPRSRERR